MHDTKIEASAAIVMVTNFRPYGHKSGQSAHEVSVACNGTGDMTVVVDLIRTKNDDGSTCHDRGYGDPGFRQEPSAFQARLTKAEIRHFARMLLAIAGPE